MHNILRKSSLFVGDQKICVKIKDVFNTQCIIYCGIIIVCGGSKNLRKNKGNA